MSDDEPDDEHVGADPFKDLESAVGDREGDPFADLGGGPPEDGGDDADEAGTADGLDETGPTDDSGTADGLDETGTTDDAGTADRLDDAETTDRSAGAAETGVGPTDRDADAEPAWPSPEGSSGSGGGATGDAGMEPEDLGESIGPDEEPGEDDPFSSASPDFEEVDLGAADEDEIWEALSAAQAAGSVADVREHTYAEVSKHTYCERCEYFTGPPKTTCTNDGTRIIEFVDMETVRVVDCPVVADRRRLEREH